MAGETEGRVGMRRILPSGLLILALSSCAQPGYYPAHMTPPPGSAYQQGEWALQPGKNTIIGHVAIKRPDGSVATCAGDGANLIPAIPAARTRMNAIYGAGRNFILVSEARSLPHDPSLDRLIKQNRCDANGDFRFTEVADGDYFITVGIRGPERASVKREIAVRGGVTRHVDITR